MAFTTVSFLWGAVPSIVLALIMQIALDVPLTASRLEPDERLELLRASVVSATFEGHQEEEEEEGSPFWRPRLALILLLLLFKRGIDSPLDGVIYGGMVGFGFAAVKNVFYLFGALTEGGVGEVLGLAFIVIFRAQPRYVHGVHGARCCPVPRNPKQSATFHSSGRGFMLSLGAHALHNALATLTGVGGAGAL